MYEINQHLLGKIAEDLEAAQLLFIRNYKIINLHKCELGGALTLFICKRIDSLHHDESGKQFSLY